MTRVERHNRARAKGKEAAKEFLYKYLNAHACVDCGIIDPRVLTFDHVTGIKTGNLADLVSHGYSIRTIQAEMDKCEVVCYNCHSRRTQKRSGHYRWLQIKNGGQ